MTKASNKKIFLNAVSAILQVVTVGAMYFFLYKFLINQIGVKQLGVWSLVVSTTSIANMANFGITSGLVKFIAEYIAKEKVDDLKKLIFTALISILMFFLIFVTIAYLLLNIFIGKIIDAQYITLAITMLPYALCCLIINEISGVFTSVLEGVQKNYLKNFIYIVTAIIFLTATFFWVPIYGLMGVVYAQLVQSFIILIAAFFTSKKYIKGFSLFAWHWDKAIFKSLISYGSKFQLISLLQILYEPTTKFLLSKFGGLQVVGFYEMASRLISQIRAVINSANQVMIPVVAHAAHNGVGNVKALYSNTMTLTLEVSVMVITAITAFSTFICNYWIGYHEVNFLFPLNILLLSTFFNLLCGPSYYSCLGEGKLNILLWVHILMAVLNIILGYMLGRIFNGNGVIVAWAISLTVGSMLLLFKYQKSKLIVFKDVFTKKHLLLLPCFIIALLMLLWGNKLLITNSIINFGLLLLVFTISTLPVLITYMKKYKKTYKTI